MFERFIVIVIMIKTKLVMICDDTRDLFLSFISNVKKGDEFIFTIEFDVYVKIM